jgi:hypothetical protein
MQAKLARFEEFEIDTRDRLARIETRLDTFATKTDLNLLKADLYKEIHSTKADMYKELHKELHGMTWKLMGSASTLVAIVYYIAKTVH